MAYFFETIRGASLIKNHVIITDAVIEEGRLMARVRHPNVVTIYGAERHDNRVGLWMELIQGQPLSQMLDELERMLARTDLQIARHYDELATPVLRPTRDWAIAKAGDSDKRQILRESTFAVLNTEAHAMVDDIPAGLTINPPTP